MLNFASWEASCGLINLLTNDKVLTVEKDCSSKTVASPSEPSNNKLVKTHHVVYIPRPRVFAYISNHFRDFHLCELARLATPLMA